MDSKRSKKKLTHQEIHEEFNQMDRFQNERILDTIKINIKCKTEKQKILVNEIREKEITICAGLPGTGKTYLSCAMALDLIKKDQKKYHKIYICKSVTTLKDEEVGFLKGSLKEKMDPYMFSFMHNFEKIIGENAVANLRLNGIIQDLPIAYTRGINIDNAILIIDESQNISVDNIRTIMTRIGTDSKFIFIGDTRQCDLKIKDNNALQFIIDTFSDLPEIGTVEFGEEDVVRNPLIKIIEQRFEKALEEKKAMTVPKTRKK